MVSEGYLQIKVRDLNEVVTELEFKVEDKKKEILDIQKSIQETLDKGVESIKPLIEVHDKLNLLNQHVENTIKREVDNYFNEFQKIIFGKQKQWLDDFINNFNKGFENKFNKVADGWWDEIINCHGRIDNLIEILNKKGYTNISSCVIDKREDSILKIRKKMEESHQIKFGERLRKQRMNKGGL